MEASVLQDALFTALKSKLQPSESLVDSVAAVLEVSTDSAYRRIRGDKELSLSELLKLSSRYNISLDHLSNNRLDAFCFYGKLANAKDFDFEDYMSSVVQQTAYLASFKSKEFFYLSKDIPVFHYFHFQPFAAFKYYFWLKTILQVPQMQHVAIDLSNYPQTIFEKGKKSLSYFNQLDTTELWNIETVNSTIRQIDFYNDAGFFKSKEDVWLVYDSFEKLITHIEQQAALGYKFNQGDSSKKPLGKFSLYFNEVIILDNSMLAITDNIKTAFLIHSAINFMLTNDTHFCDNMYRHVQALMRKSTLISSVSERERSRFFKIVRDKIESRKKLL
ncbi:MAG TPA: hypothetical protein PKM63_15495 [Panacibacter sp.]|nr:hypothetical protein [Panacibacter sp.]HNP45695.1 hypothetical protein [Panacibacter sp.]